MDGFPLSSALRSCLTCEEQVAAGLISQPSMERSSHPIGLSCRPASEYRVYVDQQQAQLFDDNLWIANHTTEQGAQTLCPNGDLRQNQYFILSNVTTLQTASEANYRLL
ncbi:hypothetical protein Q5P01_008590 [Channa striata]|uniref:Uncharacterized protein n=1 Tax=Channa striata TaxID=64152 RepID=A0AA88N3P0_CHASR|nr:hypothetical protein Q5P01_008590 [Channa striata]